MKAFCYCKHFVIFAIYVDMLVHIAIYSEKIQTILIENGVSQ